MHRQLIELNFEKRPDFESLFSSNEPQEIISNIAASFGKAIEPKNTILFLDEIQAAPHLLAKLRWFAEEMPQLPVVAAGSLLDFALADHAFSMPVGRIDDMHLNSIDKFFFTKNFEIDNISRSKKANLLLLQKIGCKIA